MRLGRAVGLMMVVGVLLVSCGPRIAPPPPVVTTTSTTQPCTGDWSSSLMNRVVTDVAVGVVRWDDTWRVTNGRTCRSTLNDSSFGVPFPSDAVVTGDVNNAGSGCYGITWKVTLGPGQSTTVVRSSTLSKPGSTPQPEWSFGCWTSWVLYRDG